MRMRQRVDERMDDPDLDPGEHDRALAGLVRLNAWSRSNWLLWPWVRAEAQAANARGTALRVIDVATGSGDAPIAMARRAAREGLRIEWMLGDRSGHVLQVAANAAAEAGVRATTVEIDLFAGKLPAEADVVTCSLFLHHCSDAQAVAALATMARAARYALFLTDLDRTRGGLALAWLGSRLLSRSPVVHFDATASVRGAFTADEARALAARAGLAEALAVEHAFPARWRLCWRRP